MIGQRLKLARSARGLSLRQLSHAIKNRVTAQAIGKYERNESMPGSSVLMALASALDVTIGYLMSDPDLALDDLEFRKKSHARKREEAQVKAKVLDRLDRYLTVEALLHLPSVGWDKPREAPYPVERGEPEADLAAQNVRMDWGLGLDPIPNMMELLEERGIKAISVPLGNIDGMTAKVRRRENTFAPVIVVNADHWGERQRFTAAHELGHLMMSVNRALDEEKAAHRFAGAFLMPAKTLWSEIGKRRKSISPGELLDLKQLLGVSVQAIVSRCKDLGIISDSMYRALFQKFTQLGWRTPPYREPLALPREQPLRFERLCFRATSENAVSESKAAELLGISVHALMKKMNQPEAPGKTCRE